MLAGGIKGVPSNLFSGNRNAAAQTGGTSFQNLLRDAASGSDPVFKSGNPVENRREAEDNPGINGTVPKEKKNGLNLVGAKVPDQVKDAWEQAEKESGTNGAAQEPDGMLSQITKLFSMGLTKFYQEGSSDILGSTEESAAAAVKKALELLGIPQTEAERKEKLFYEAFLRYL